MIRTGLILFALADVLGVNYRGLPISSPSKPEDLDVNFAKGIGPDYWEKRKNVFDYLQSPGAFTHQGKMSLYVGDEPVTFKGPAVRVETRGKDAKVAGTLRAKSVAGAPEMPGVIENSFGKGKVV